MADARLSATPRHGLARQVRERAWRRSRPLVSRITSSAAAL